MIESPRPQTGLTVQNVRVAWFCQQARIQSRLSYLKSSSVPTERCSTVAVRGAPSDVLPQMS